MRSNQREESGAGGVNSFNRISVSGSRAGSRAVNGLDGNQINLLGAQSSSMIIGNRARMGAGGGTSGASRGAGLRPHHNLVGGS